VRGETPPLDVVRGRCIVSGVRAPQKFCWVQLPGPRTLKEYLARYTDQPPKPPLCPLCGTQTRSHARFWRHVAEDPLYPTRVPLYRALCPNPQCPAVTVTLYPPFLTPYSQFPTEIREGAVRDHDAGVAWSRIAAQVQVSIKTLRRWARRVRARAAALQAGFFCILIRFDAQSRLPSARDGPSLWALGDCAAALVQCPDWPRLSVARFPLRSPALPVWA